MEIKNCTIKEIDEIFTLYRIATAYQKSKHMVYWPEFGRPLVETEINENRQWELIIDGVVACNWAITFSDPQIWEKHNIDKAIYIHRIATNPGFRGRNFVAEIVNWAKEYAKSINKDFIRMDTIGNNTKLIEHYTNAGFDYIGYVKLKDTNDLPMHYNNASVCLFEIKL